MSQQRPEFPQELPTECPRCGSKEFVRLAPNVLSSTEPWFECASCRHLWMLRGNPAGDREEKTG